MAEARRAAAAACAAAWCKANEIQATVGFLPTVTGFVWNLPGQPTSVGRHRCDGCKLVNLDRTIRFVVHQALQASDRNDLPRERFVSCPTAGSNLAPQAAKRNLNH